MAEKNKSEHSGHGHGIRRVEIEPADTGGFITRVVHKAKDGGKGAEIAMPPPDALHVHADTNQLANFFHSTFPGTGGKSRAKKGKTSTSVKGGSRVDTYEGAQGDEVGE